MPPPQKKQNTPSIPAAKPATPTPSAPIAERSEIKGSGKPKAPATPQFSQEDIARRAFEIYAGRGYAQGDQNADWLEAERQLKAGL